MIARVMLSVCGEYVEEGLDGGGDRLKQIGEDEIFFFSSRRRHTRFDCDWSSDVCSSDLALRQVAGGRHPGEHTAQQQKKDPGKNQNQGQRETFETRCD